MDVDPNLVKQTAPGLVGAIGATLFLKDPWPVRVGMVFPGAAMAFFGAAHVAQVSGMPEGLAGFVVGMLGMVMMGKIITTWQNFELGAILGQWLRKVLGIQQGGDQ